MRDYSGCAPASLPPPGSPEFTPRLRTMLNAIDYYLRDSSQGFARIEHGQAPSGSGATIGVTDHGSLSGLGDDDHTQYALLAGRSAGDTQTWKTTSGATHVAINPSTPSLALTGGSDLLTMKAASLIQTNGSANSTLSVRGDSAIELGTGSLTNALIFQSSDLTAAAYAARMNAGHTGHHWEWQTSAGVVLAYVDKDGNASFTSVSSTGTSTFTDSLFAIADNATPTKKLAFECSGITAATTRTLTVPNRSSTIATLTGIQTFDGQPYFTNGTVDGPALEVGVQPSISSFDGLSGLVLRDEASGFKLQVFSTTTTGFTADRWINFPDGDGTVMLTEATQTVNSKTMGTTTVLTSNTTSVGANFAHTSDVTKKFRLVLSGAAGNNSLAIATTAARAYKTSNADQTFSGTLFAQTADKTVGNTVTETTIFGTGQGSLTLPASFFVAGRTVRIRMSGIYSTVAVTGDTVTAKVKYGSVVLASKATTALLVGATNAYWEGEVDIVCRTAGATGTVMTSGRVGYQITGNAVVWDELNNAAATSTIDTTAATALDVTITHSAANASNTATSIVATVEVLY